MRRTLITGAPRTGKTTMALSLTKAHVPSVFKRDQLRHFCTDPQHLCPAGVNGTPPELDWSACSQWVCDKWLSLPGPWVIEGVAVPRALRKWQAAHPNEPPPCDQLIVLTEPHEALSQRQEAMGIGLLSVLADLGDWLAPVLVHR